MVEDSTFDSATLAPYTVIRVPEAFGSVLPKRFVVFGHDWSVGAALCVKTTSQTLAYKNSVEMMESCIFYEKDTCPDCFSEETAVQPDNTVAYLHADLNKWFANGSLKIFGCLPAEYFEKEIARALDGGRATDLIKKKILEHIRANQRKRESTKKKN